MEKRQNKALWYAVFASFILLLAVAGYAGYALYPRFDLPAVTGASMLILAAGAGVASFFTPCSFPLLTALLARSIAAYEERAFTRAVRYGGALALGAGVFLLLAGAGIALGAGVLFQRVTFTSTAGRLLRVVVGVLLIILGFAQLEKLALSFDKLTSLTTPIRKYQTRIRKERPTLGFVTFGFGYILGGFG